MYPGRYKCIQGDISVSRATKVYPGRHKCIQGDISVSRALENTFTVTKCEVRTDEIPANRH